MLPTDFLTSLRCRGGDLYLQGTRICYRGPDNILTAAIRDYIVQKKAELTALLPPEADGPLPYITSSGDLVIPLNTPKPYRWWQGGQSIAETLRELNVPMEVCCRYAAVSGAIAGR